MKVRRVTPEISKLTRYGGGHSLYGCVAPKRYWYKWIVMKVRRVTPEIAKFSLPVFTAIFSEMSHVLLRATKTWSNAQSNTYSSTMFALKPKPVQYKRT